ncbi:MAG TPA: ClcB-like voltage-gated chloride channel protein [Telluria sp.]|nr:ClcB-like voltage-gated chloride channel protein [Telluria sp.]
MTRWTTRLWLLERLVPGEQQRMLGLAAAIGILGGLATVGFRELLAASQNLLYGQHASLVRAAHALPAWERVLIPAAGGLLAGLVLLAARRFEHDRAGDYMEAIALSDRPLGVRHSLLRALSSAASIVSGSSIGREGSMVQLAALTGSVLPVGRDMAPPRRRLMVACGGAAGIAAAYNAPIAGALFIAEIVLCSIAVETLGPLLVAAVTSSLTVHAFLGYATVYTMPAFQLLNPAEIGLHGLLGIVAGLLAPYYLGLLDAVRQGFHKLALPLPASLALGGALVGVLSVWQPEIWGNGYSIVNGILAGQWATGFLVAVLLSKVLATAITTGSGAVGGVFTPTLFVGAVLGSLFGTACHMLWPGIAPAAVYAAIGMGAMLAATTFAPLTAILIIFEMTGNYQIMLPLMLASVLAYTLTRLRRDRSVYSRSLERPPSRFATLSVGDIMRKGPPTVARGASAETVERAFVTARWQHVYMVDGSGGFAGAVSLHDLGPALRAGLPPQEPLGAQWIKRDYPRLQPDMRLGAALERFAAHPGERLPVVDAGGRLQGYVSKTDLFLLLQESAAAQ